MVYRKKKLSLHDIYVYLTSSGLKDLFHLAIAKFLSTAKGSGLIPPPIVVEGGDDSINGLSQEWQGGVFYRHFERSVAIFLDGHVALQAPLQDGKKDVWLLYPDSSQSFYSERLGYIIPWIFKHQFL